MVKFVFLTPKFYEDYAGCSEIEKKPLRPHVQAKITVGGVVFCVPMRSNVTHKHILLTDKENNCGLDFSKTVVITNQKKYIESVTAPQIRQNEFDALRGKEHIIETRLTRYIKEYKKAKTLQHIPRYRTMVKYSTLQYFEKYI